MADKTPTPTINGNAKSSILTSSPYQRIVGQMARLTSRSSDVENDLLRDTWATYYRQAPAMRDATDVHPDRVINHQLIDWATKAPGWEASRMVTVNRLIVSAKSAELMTEMLVSDPAIRDALEKQKKAEEKQQQADEMQKAADGAPKGGAGQAQAQAQANQLQAQADALRGQAQQQVAQRIGDPRMNAMRAAAVSQAQKEGEKAAAMLKACGIDDGNLDEQNDADIDALMKLMKDDELSALVQQMGRAEGVAMKTLAGKAKVEVVIADAGLTRNFMDLFPGSRALLRPDVTPVIRAKAAADFLSHGALGVVRSTQTQYRGALIMGVDGSGSMHGEPNTRAKALMLGISNAAEQTGQEWAAFIFGSTHEQTDAIMTGAALSEKVAFAKKLYGGGTNFDAALSHAYGLLDGLEESIQASADIVLITDGECGISDDTLALHERYKNSLGTRLIAILVDSDSGYDDIKEIADATITIESTGDIAQAAEQLSAALWKSEGGE